MEREKVMMELLEMIAIGYHTFLYVPVLLTVAYICTFFYQLMIGDRDWTYEGGKIFLGIISIVSIAIVTMIAYFIGLEESHGLAATLAFATLCLSRLFHGFNCRSKEFIFNIGLFSNMYSIGAFVTGFVLLNSILLLPQLNSLFMVTDITLNQLGIIYLLGFIPTLIIQMNRWMKTNKE